MILVIGAMSFTDVEYHLRLPMPVLYLPIAGAALVAIWLGFMKNADSLLAY